MNTSQRRRFGGGKVQAGEWADDYLLLERCDAAGHLAHPILIALTQLLLESGRRSAELGPVARLLPLPLDTDARRLRLPVLRFALPVLACYRLLAAADGRDARASA